MSSKASPTLAGEILDEQLELSLAELCRACQVAPAQVTEYVSEGIIEPCAGEPGQWRFRGVSVIRMRSALRLQRDLGVNVAGAALALDLLDELDRLRMQLRGDAR